MDFNKAKKVAASCLAMSTCGFILWTSQTHIQADTVNAQEQQVQQPQQTTKAATANQFAAQTSATNEQQSGENYDQNDHGNYACLDSAKLNDQAQLTVSGWHATNGSQGRPYHYIIAYDSTNHREISRQNITNREVNRPDVQKVHNVYGANKSGFNVSFNLKQQLANLQNIQIVSRYTDDQAGNGNAADYWFAPITIDRNNYGNLDGAKIVDQQLQLSGWNANNLSENKPYHYIILLDRTTNREVSRVLVKNRLQRLDVEKAYPEIENAAQSGFSVLLNTKNVNFSHQLQALSRFSGSADGNSDYVDFYFAPITTGNYANQGHLDQFSLVDGQHLNISGWHANDVANFETNHFLILFDNTANRQVAAQVVPTVQRTDVARAFPGIHQAGQSGFTTSFDLKNIRLTPGHSYSVVSRYSTSNAGNGGSGQYTDYWFSPITLNQQGAWLDSVKMTNDGLQVSGWMLSDHALNQPNAYIFVLNNGREVTRKKVTLSSRPDVAAKYGQAYNSQNSGFSTLLQLDPALINGNMQILLRFAADPAGNKNYTDVFYSNNYSSNAGYFDKITVTQTGVYVSGWHAANQSNKEEYQFIIAMDAANNKEIARWSITKQSGLERSDVQRAYPWIVNSNKSGFNLTVNNIHLTSHSNVYFIHRYTNDPSGNGDYVDYNSKLITFSNYNMYANAINAYIINNCIGHANIQYHYVIPQVTGAYRGTGNGRPNMVIVHETDIRNDSLWADIEMEHNTYHWAFVHAFVDGNNIVEISPTNREAWGAGYPANGRGVQFEQVEVTGKDNFARELVNAAYYTAYNMKQYGMVPVLNGPNGTLLSHHMISMYFGGTDHVDPDGYWARNANSYFGTGYTINDFFELVKYEYAQL